MGDAITFSRHVARMAGISALLGVGRVRWALSKHTMLTNSSDIVVGWGTKPSTRRARGFADRNGLRVLSLEDGFVRSVGLGVTGSRPYSVVVDDIGIYYDARRPSRLELLLNGEAVAALPGAESDPASDVSLDDPELLSRARDCMARIVAARLSKYNSSPERELPRADRPRVLVVDQRAGDQSIVGGLAGPETFDSMLVAARREHPGAEILIKTHPDVVSGRKRGHFGLSDVDDRTRLLTEDINPIHLLEQVDHVYVVSSQMGLEALFVGRPVTCFGVPFYAGWGLTDDRQATPSRTRSRSLEQVFAAAYLLYTRYLDPGFGTRCQLERVLEHLGLQRAWFARNAGTWLVCGVSWPKRPQVRRDLHSPWNSVRFFQRAQQIPGGLDPRETRILVRELDDTPVLRARAEACGYPVWRMENGPLLCATGSGTDPGAPLSLVIDSSGMYYDPGRPSDLETWLATARFDATELGRARILRQRLLQTRLSKYNAGFPEQPLQLQARPKQRVVLVPGQVPQDASVRLGCPDIASDAALLAAVRSANPNAYILYKPHPDVVSGNRSAGPVRPNPLDYDQRVDSANIVACLDAADEVHTMTSLVGFEALLRGKRVVTYGLPFYAGWGLTDDRHTLARRNRRLSLDELVAGALLHYPRYVNDLTGEFTTAEWTVERLAAAAADVSPLRRDVLHRLARTVRAFIAGVSGELRSMRKSPRSQRSRT